MDDIVVGNAMPLLLFVKTAALGGIYISVYFLVGLLHLSPARSYEPPRASSPCWCCSFSARCACPSSASSKRSTRPPISTGRKLDLGLREQIGQMGFLAALSGFRALVADGLYLHAHALWERTEWGRMKLNFDAVDRAPAALHPLLGSGRRGTWPSMPASPPTRTRSSRARRCGSRPSANIGSSARTTCSAASPTIPTSPLLYDRLGFLYREKFKDHCKSAEALRPLRASARTRRRTRSRFAAYELAQCPGHEREAYERLLALYREGEDEHLPTLLKWLGTLQEKLNVPAEQKIDIPPPANP